MEQASQAPPKTFQTSYVGMALWDEVKRTMYSYWCICNDYLFEIDQMRLYNSELKDFGTKGEKFKASVLKLYRSSRSKLNYHADNSSVIQLKAMEMDNTLLDLSKAFDFKQALKAFLLLTDFLEIDGVTFFEKKVPDAMHGAVTQLEEGD